MKVIDVTREHDLDHDTVRRRAETLADRLKQKVAIEWWWNGDRIEFTRRGASGHVEVSARRVHVVIELGLLLRPLAGKVESKVEQYLDEALAVPGGAGG